ncbi:MAG: exodeoxyribonuclease VII small subunit [Dehalococcoidia bacterium]|nr:exodeoxyribonuclease VII small subunit [Dehalococcoidia bacterium]
MSANSGSQDENLSFEDAYTLLEEKVSTLEQGGLSLEESILLFEQGMNLLNVCSELLSSAELRITNLQNIYSGKNDISQDGVEEIDEN